MSKEIQQEADLLHEKAHHASNAAPAATVTSGVLGALFDEFEKTEDLKHEAGKLRELILGEGAWRSLPSARSFSRIRHDSHGIEHHSQVPQDHRAGVGAHRRKLRGLRA